ncbi:MAG: hypothetical protein L3J32_05560 [Rhizobiaceae bacterium]|nr:hypothetical protein [Rhizobiaceae bacterium]
MILASPIDLSPILQSPETITPSDVRQFRQEIFRDGLVSKSEADALFMINEATNEQCDEWHEFFVEALSDFTVAQMEPRGYVSVENSEWLIRQISRDGRISGPSELEMLVKTIEKASQCPQTLVDYVLNQVAELVIDGEGELIRGKSLTKGIIGEDETEVLRRVLYGSASDGGTAISKREAEILFDLNDKTVEVKNHASWNILFVKAIANHLMAVSGYQMPDRQTAFSREQWLQDDGIDVAGTLKNALSSFGSLFSDGNFKDAFKSDHKRVEEAWADRNEAIEQETEISEKIDSEETHWLVERIGRDGNFHENEKALIRFLKEESPQIHPSLQPLLDKVA